MHGMTAMRWVAVVVSMASPAVGRAQLNQQKFQSEVRIDGIFARTGGVEAGYGFTVPSGIYVRSGLVAGIGAGAQGIEGRTDLISRFSLDPFRQSRWAPYGGAGLSGRYRNDRDGGSRAYLLVFFGLEGPLALGAREGWVPAFEVGLGGGARVGVILRRGINARR
jgi:hypothetical protein